MKEGDIIVRPNECIGSIEIGLLAACGWEQVNVIKEIPIGILTVSDKLQEFRESLKHPYNSNRVALFLLLKENGFNSLDFKISIKK